MKTKIQILLIEDNEYDAEEIQLCLENKENFKVAGIADNLEDAYRIYFSKEIDIVIIDIYLNKKPDGIKFAETIMSSEKLRRPFVFLTNSMSRTTFESAKLTKPYSYLLKPLNEVELIYALELALEKFAEEPNLFIKYKHPSVYYNKTFFIKKNNILMKILENDIQFVTVEGRYSKITTAVETFLVQLSLKQFLKTASSNFVRIHRNYVVNFEKIEKVFLLDNLIQLKSGATVTLSRQYKKAFIASYEVFI